MKALLSLLILLLIAPAASAGWDATVEGSPIETVTHASGETHGAGGPHATPSVATTTPTTLPLDAVTLDGLATITAYWVGGAPEILSAATMVYNASLYAFDGTTETLVQCNLVTIQRPDIGGLLAPGIVDSHELTLRVACPETTLPALPVSLRAVILEQDDTGIDAPDVLYFSAEMTTTYYTAENMTNDLTEAALLFLPLLMLVGFTIAAHRDDFNATAVLLHIGAILVASGLAINPPAEFEGYRFYVVLLALYNASRLTLSGLETKQNLRED